MNSESEQRFILNFPTTHNFIYKDYKYPFNFDIFKYFSKSLFKEQENIIKLTEIHLLSDEEESQIDLSDDTINNFIRFCQQHNYKINNDNAIHLNYLSKKYEVDELTKITEKYILNNQNDLRLQLLSFSQNNIGNTEQLEKIIADNLQNYIIDEKFLDLPLPTIYRIFQSNTDQQLREKSEFIEFLFKCLDKFGMNASVLFTDIDFGKLPSLYHKRLLTEYSQKFDFHFINSSFTKSTYQMANELLQKVESFDDMNDNFNSKFQEQTTNVESKINELSDQISNSKSDFNTKFQEQTTNVESKINELSDQINISKSDFNSKLQEQKNDQEQKNTQLASEIENVKKEMRQEFRDLLNEQKSSDEQRIKELSDGIDILRGEMIRMNSVFDKVYPVGSIYMSVNPTSPQNLFGGNWQSWGQ